MGDSTLLNQGRAESTLPQTQEIENPLPYPDYIKGLHSASGLARVCQDARFMPGRTMGSRNDQETSLFLLNVLTKTLYIRQLAEC